MRPLSPASESFAVADCLSVATLYQDSPREQRLVIGFGLLIIGIVGPAVTWYYERFTRQSGTKYSSDTDWMKEELVKMQTEEKKRPKASFRLE